VLGTHRADAVRDYLLHLGVGETAISHTSRGELDAEGTDEDGWRRDRRVDVNLAKR
jgi:peptidoglycan-associated lipoprotein